MKVLETDIQEFTHIIHVADIHVRLTKRHEEYNEVFNKFYEEVKKSPNTTIICVLGDVCHNKSDLSPECVQMVSNFLNTLADLRPTVLIPGNHDATLSNKSRLDSLTPIVDAISHSNLFYLKETGLYGLGNVLLNVMSIFDDPDKYIRGKDIPEIYRNQYKHIVALFHGTVDQACTDLGYKMSNPAIMLPLFDWNDIVLLGDIHAKQNMQEYNPSEHKPCVHYPGSLIQQNHGEPLLGHGYSLWDLELRVYTHVEIPNDYGYFTIEVNNGKLVTDIKNIPKKARIRVQCFETIATEVKSIISKIKSITDITEVSYIRVKSDKDINVAPVCKNIVLNDLTNSDYQGKLIEEFLKSKLDIKDQTKIDKVLLINKSINTRIKRDEFPRNLKWKPKKFEWDSMFTYGEGNVVNFEHLDGVVGIFAPNTSGKSSLLSALTFCLFDKWDRGFKGEHALNVEKSSFKCKLNFEINDINYFIERVGTVTRTGSVKVDVRFWKVENGKEIDLNSTDRRKTNDVIREYVGSYDEFILTVLSIQSGKNNISFIDLGNSERKDLLVQFLGLNIFDRLQEVADKSYKDIRAVLKTHEGKNYVQELSDYQDSLSKMSKEYETEEKNYNDLQDQVNKVNNEILKETKKLIKLDTDVPSDLRLLESKKSSIENTIKDYNSMLSGYKTEKIEQEKLIKELDKNISEIESSKFIESHKIFKDLSSNKVNTDKSLDFKNMEIRNKNEKLDKLKEHKYDPNCKFCMDNIFVKDAIATKSQLESVIKDRDELLKTSLELAKEIDKYSWTNDVYQNYTKFLNNRSKLKDDYSKTEKNIFISEKEIEKETELLNKVVSQIASYHRNEVSIEYNDKINSNIFAFRNALVSLDLSLQKSNRHLRDLSGSIALLKNQIESLKVSIDKVRTLEEDYASHELYLSAVGRDGIPHEVIFCAVPEIEREVNSILNQIVEFTLSFENDGKNISPYVVYDNRRWPVEMSSGFERFVESIAIRVALTNISNLPKTTFLVLDEGFSTLDTNNLQSMSALFSFLRSQFDFILIISHLDAMRDMVDKTIEIKKEGNHSKVVYE